MKGPFEAKVEFATPFKVVMAEPYVIMGQGVTAAEPNGPAGAKPAAKEASRDWMYVLVIVGLVIVIAVMSRKGKRQ